LLRSLQEIQLDFVEEAKAYAGLWSQAQKKKKKKKKKKVFPLL
jgi:1-aminocyclopropane-1-carboxylate deaminase/D-cysteine desulfhydrase-like pyridoxal-dependent ACC family enzyme